MLTRKDKFTFSKNFYALNLDGLTINRYQHTPSVAGIVIPAVWFKRKNGTETVSVGTLGAAVRFDTFDSGENVTPAEIIEWLTEKFDGRYGGNPHYQWDGEKMWAPGRTFQEQAAQLPKLTEYLNNFPSIPDGYAGWFSIN